MKTEKKILNVRIQYTCMSRKHPASPRRPSRYGVTLDRAAERVPPLGTSPSSLGLGSAAVSRGRGGRVWQRSVCECTCTRAQLTQSEKCCVATAYKGTRLRVRMCLACLYVCACVCFANRAPHTGRPLTGSISCLLCTNIRRVSPTDAAITAPVSL